MIPYYIFAWIASVMYGLEAITSKLTGKYSISNPWLFNFFWSLFIFIFTVPVALYYGVKIPTDWNSIIAAGFFYALGSLLWILSLYLLDVSVLVPLFNFRNVFAVILGFLLLGEVLDSRKILLIAGIFIAGMFVSVDEKLTIRSFFQKRIFLALAGILALVFMAIFIKISSASNGFWTTSFWMPLIGQIFLFSTWPKFQRNLGEISLKQAGVLALIGFMGVIGTLTANKAYSLNVGISAVITSVPISMILVFLLSYFAPELLEKHTLKVYAIRFIATVVMIVLALQLTQS